MMYPEVEHIQTLLSELQRIVILQADNPDADSLGSALALEHILGDLGKQPFLYCGVDIPGYLRYIAGWDRVSKDLPTQFDCSIVVDTSTITLFEKLMHSDQKHWVSSKPCIVLDHHKETNNDIPFATATINDAASSSTGELVYHVAQELDWPRNTEASAHIMTAILGDTQGLTNQLASAETYRVMAELTEAGVQRPKLEEARREYVKMVPSIFKYKATLIERTDFFADGRLALVSIPQIELNEYSPLYNPGPLIQPDMLGTAGVRVAIVLKRYDDGKITAAIRCNNGSGIAGELAEHFGGGGHAYAAGFKITDGRKFEDIKFEAINLATELLAKLELEPNDESA